MGLGRLDAHELGVGGSGRYRREVGEGRKRQIPVIRRCHADNNVRIVGEVVD